MSPQQSSGTILGYLNVTDPDNEIFDTKSQENCEKKQQLRITIDSEHEDLLPFKVADGYLVKYGVSMGIYVRLLDVIDQTRGRVFHQDIQTPRSVLKNEAIGRVF